MSIDEISQNISAAEKTYLSELEKYLAHFFQQQHTILNSISSESLALLTSIQQLSTGGKRLRALLAYWGWRAAGGSATAEEIVRAGAAIELFQSAALIHDDIIDRSDTRRGAPAVHKQFQATHTENSWRTDSFQFGTSSAIIAGDLCLSWSEQVFSSIPKLSQAGTYAREIFDLMRTEVMAGQYLDILGEVVGTESNDQAISRARKVIRYKAAKYSCEHPLVLGGSLALNLPSPVAETSLPPLIQQFQAFALPLGEAFQMRDDVLGVFGKTEDTGKPAGDDLREGKRTVLVALTQRHTDDEQWRKLDGQLGSQELTANDISELQEIIESSGALGELEQEIESTGANAHRVLAEMNLDRLSQGALENIVQRLLHRSV